MTITVTEFTINAYSEIDMDSISFGALGLIFSLMALEEKSISLDELKRISNKSDRETLPYLLEELERNHYIKITA